jgi:hypothetical protein
MKKISRNWQYHLITGWRSDGVFTTKTILLIMFFVVLVVFIILTLVQCRGII